MTANDSARVTQPKSATRECAPGGGRRSARNININPETGLATDYLNHFNEAIMMLEMVGDCPECVDDFRAWRPLSYREHFAYSRFRDRDVAIAAYDAAEPNARHCLQTLADTMTSVLETTRDAMHSELPPENARLIAARASAWLKPLVARAGAVINGETGADIGNADARQAAVDLLMRSNK